MFRKKSDRALLIACFLISVLTYGSYILSRFFALLLGGADSGAGSNFSWITDFGSVIFSGEISFIAINFLVIVFVMLVATFLPFIIIRAAVRWLSRGE